MQLVRAMLWPVKSLTVLPAAVTLALSASSAWFAGTALAEPASSQAVPPLSGGASGASAPAAAFPAVSDASAANGAAMAASAQSLYAHVLRGVVAIERSGSPMAIGTVLGGDGRILTSLSGLGGADAPDVRYSDGTTVHTKVGHSDKVTDLALLVPESAHQTAHESAHESTWLEGLAASEAEPVGAALRAILPARGAHLGPAEASVKKRVDARARDGEPLRQMLEVDVKGPLVAGAPLIDTAGSVMAVLVRACKGVSAPDAAPWAAWAAQAGSAQSKPAACAPVVLGAPVSFIRSFLADVPAQAAVPAPWLGILGEAQVTGAAHGVRVVAVAPSSPAEKAKLKAGADVIVAVDGHPIDTPDKLAASIAKHAPGDSVKLLLYGEDRFREVTVPLQAAP